MILMPPLHWLQFSAHPALSACYTPAFCPPVREFPQCGLCWAPCFSAGVIFRVHMELPVHDVVNTGEETFRQGMTGQQGFINVCLTREVANQPWGFRLQGGKDRGLPFQLLKVCNIKIKIANIS